MEVGTEQLIEIVDEVMTAMVTFTLDSRSRGSNAGRFGHTGLRQLINCQKSMWIYQEMKAHEAETPCMIETLLHKSSSKATIDPFLYLAMGLYTVYY